MIKLDMAKSLRKELSSLERKADALFQIRMREKYPVSIISGLPTEVIHHYVPKSQSNNLRYDELNAIPLTCAEHFRHHTCGDPNIMATILKKKGQDWNDDLQLRRRTICKHTIEYLQKIIENLSSKLPF